jgi:aminomethyltransferase
MTAELPPELDAIRTRVGWSRGDSVAVLALRGDDARDALLHLLPSRLHLRDAQARESLLLDDAGRPIADVIVCADDEDYFLLVEGLDADTLVAHVAAHLPSGLAPQIESLSSSHEVISVDGPWAWELIAEALGSDLIALPYLNFFRIDHGYCVRAGKTGEYGYDLVVRREAADEVAQALSAAGEGFGLVHVGEAARSLCRFENWFFDPAHVPAGATPIELGLSWRLDASRSWVGKEAVDRRRETASRRLTCLVGAKEFEKGDAVLLGDRAIGEIVRAERSPLRGEWIAAALIDREWAHGGIDRYEVRGHRVRTMAPPLVDNRSLYVDPRRHSWRTADEIVFPPLVRGARAPA